MADSFSRTQIKQLKSVVIEALDERLEMKLDAKLGEDFMDRIDRIENNTDMACKIAKDTQEEMVILGSKVDRHDTEIKSLQNFAGFAIA